jgi:amino acid transporter
VNQSRIVALMVLFTVAIGFDVAAISGLAAIGGWWMLAFVFAVHLAATVVVMVAVADVIAGRTRPTETAVVRILSRSFGPRSRRRA